MTRFASDGDFTSLLYRTAPNHSVTLEAFILDDILAGSVGALRAASARRRLSLAGVFASTDDVVSGAAMFRAKPTVTQH